MDITILAPDDLTGPPNYEGPLASVHSILNDGIYEISETRQDGIINDNPQLAVVVSKHSSFLVTVVTVDHTSATADCGTVPVAPIGAGREFRALTTVETAERIALRAIAILEDGHTDPDEAVNHARHLLTALVGITTRTTATAVKNQADSDAISSHSTADVRSVLAQFDDEDRVLADRYSRLDHKYHR